MSSPYLLGGAVDLLADAGTTSAELAAASRLTVEQIDEIVTAGRETTPSLQLGVHPRS
ncbi:hypothetical protein [Saccharopolyspora erythraea]|uniref:hypothetical protein n=1 Tax=Saccharopolyspora erythraea TaxID=1836 RepID=UPI0001D30DD2|nr:hypothetical protein [Saccharopolyspora erythraea]EQD82643.1 hypothetical protein N599_29570 [Saccharopolyspora erythraea D]QRK88106.1 hypothetical protein JQX30_25780 [Saccharopolyspora erythraea]